MDKGFRGMQWQPGCEQEVVFLFGVLLAKLPIPLAIDEIRTAYPDCLALRTDTNQAVRIEFELYGSHFWNHRHDPAGCDIVVCWRDDYGSWPASIQVIELADVARHHLPGFFLSDRPKRERTLWEKELFDQHADEEVKAIIAALEAQIQHLPNVRLLYNGRGKEPTCNICLTPGDHKIFWIWADGRYQWCWECFRKGRADIVKLYQQLLGSDNKSSCMVAKLGALVSLGADRVMEVIRKIEAVSRERRSPRDAETDSSNGR